MELKLILEAILFTAQKPLTPHEIRGLLNTTAEQSEDESATPFKKVPEANILAALEELHREHEAAQRTYRLVCVAGSWQFVCQPDYAPWLKTMVGHKLRPPRLSQPALETLAVISYRQPVTRAEVEQVRGVSVDGVMQTLLDRGLVVQTGRAEVVGRPALYGTTALFLEYFGLRSLEELPAADELRRLPIEKPELLLTVDPHLATAPEEPQLPLADRESFAETASEPAPETVPPLAAEPAPESAPQPRTPENL
jgi:segregation and condensation protein B